MALDARVLFERVSGLHYVIHEIAISLTPRWGSTSGSRTTSLAANPA
jgi:hypothetical protein